MGAGSFPEKLMRVFMDIPSEKLVGSVGAAPIDNLVFTSSAVINIELSFLQDSSLFRLPRSNQEIVFGIKLNSTDESFLSSVVSWQFHSNIDRYVGALNLDNEAIIAAMGDEDSIQALAQLRFKAGSTGPVFSQRIPVTIFRNIITGSEPGPDPRFVPDIVRLAMTITEDSSAGEMRTTLGGRLAPAISAGESVCVTGNIWAKNGNFVRFWDVNATVIRPVQGGSPEFVGDPVFTILHSVATVGGVYDPSFVISGNDLTLTADSDKAHWGATLNVFHDLYTAPVDEGGGDGGDES